VEREDFFTSCTLSSGYIFKVHMDIDFYQPVTAAVIKKDGKILIAKRKKPIWDISGVYSDLFEH